MPSGSVTPAGGGGAQNVLVATTGLTAAQLIALTDTNPFTIVAAVANKVILPVRFTMSLPTGSTAYNMGVSVRMAWAPSFAASDLGFTTGTVTPGHVRVEDAFTQFCAGQLFTTTNGLGQDLIVDTSNTYANGTGTLAITTHYMLLSGVS